MIDRFLESVFRLYLANMSSLCFERLEKEGFQSNVWKSSKVQENEIVNVCSIKSFSQPKLVSVSAFFPIASFSKSLLPCCSYGSHHKWSSNRIFSVDKWLFVCLEAHATVYRAFLI